MLNFIYKAINKRTLDDVRFKILDNEIFFYENGTWYSDVHSKYDDYVLLIDTNIKDKHGNNIYVGDILEYKTPFDRRIKSVCTVIYLDTLEASFGFIDLYGNQVPLYTLTANTYSEIVGNKYLDGKIENSRFSK